MKTPQVIVLGLTLLLLTACGTFQPPSRNSRTLSLKLECPRMEVFTIEDFQCKASLSNQSDSSVLVHTRLFWLPIHYAPPASIEMLILVSDTSGNFVKNNGMLPNYHLPGEDTLDVLRPGAQATRVFYLKDWFFLDAFKRGEKYSIVAIYQNEIDITKTIDDEVVPSWVGSIRSNEETFVFQP